MFRKSLFFLSYLFFHSFAVNNHTNILFYDRFVWMVKWVFPLRSYSIGVLHSVHWKKRKWVSSSRSSRGLMENWLIYSKPFRFIISVGMYRKWFFLAALIAKRNELEYRQRGWNRRSTEKILPSKPLFY